MAISFVNSGGANATSITIPTGFVAGDIILIFAYSSTTVAPTLPAGYTSIFVQTTNSALRLGYKIAAGGDTSGTWTGADYLLCGVYRGVSGIGGANSVSNTTSTTTTISGVATFTNATGTSWVVSAAGSNQGTSMSTPAGTTLRTSQTNGTVDMGLLLDFNAGVTAYGQKLSTNGVTAVSGGGSVELVAAVTGINRIATQDATGTGATSATATYPAVPTAGNLLIAVETNDNLNTGLTNSGWTFAHNALTNSASTNLSVLYKVAGAGEPKIITTVTDAGSFNSAIAIYEYTGFTGTPTLDKTVSLGTITAALTAPTGTTATTTAAAELLFAAAQFSTANTVSSWSNSFVARNSVTTAGNGQYTADLVVAATGAYSTTLTATGTATISVAGLVTFKGVVSVITAHNLTLLGIGS